MTLERLTLGHPNFWHRPLQDRMDDFAAMSQVAPFTHASTLNGLTGEIDEYFAVTRYAELVGSLGRVELNDEPLQVGLINTLRNSNA